MIGSIACAGVALRFGLILRRARRRGGAARDLRARHLRWAKAAVVGVTLGFAGGVASMVWLRDRAPFETAHSYVAVVALGLFLCSGVLGWRLQRGAPTSRDAHALIAACAVLSAGLAFATGWVLLP
jgi:hypothetical protein